MKFPISNETKFYLVVVYIAHVCIDIIGGHSLQKIMHLKFYPIFYFDMPP